MELFNLNEEILLTVSAAYARQRFLCSGEYAAGVCHGACCTGPSVVLLSNREAVDIKKNYPSLQIHGRILFVTGKQCPLALPNGHCKVYGTDLKPFICTAMPFVLNRVGGKLILDNGFMRRSCRVRNDEEGGQLAYRAFRSAMTSIFGESGADRLTKHLDSGGGDISLPVTKEVMRELQWHREVLDDIKKYGYRDTVTKLSGGKFCL